jgi:hypothetical protein
VKEFLWITSRLLRARSRSWDLKILRVFLSSPCRSGTKIVEEAGAVSAQRKILKSKEQRFILVSHVLNPGHTSWPGWPGTTRTFTAQFHTFWLEILSVFHRKRRNRLSVHLFWDSVGFLIEISPQFGNFSSYFWDSYFFFFGFKVVFYSFPSSNQ